MDKITLSWFNPDKTVVLATYNEDGWTWEVLFEILKEQRKMIESVNHPYVDVVVDVRKSGWMPKEGSLMTPIRKFMAEQHPRQGKTIFVGARGIVSSIISILGTMLGPKRQDLIFVKTMDEVQPRLAQIAAFRQAEEEKKKLRPTK
jgi:hypothetical protein